MVAVEDIEIEMSACNGWRSNPLTTHCARINDSLVNPVPCYNGKSLQISEELVVNGLSAISIKHHEGRCMLSDGDDELKEGKRKFSTKKCGLPVCLGERIKRRNSFWNMHRPELSKLTWPKNYISSDMLQDFFHSHLQTHGTFCEPLHIRDAISNEGLRDYPILRFNFRPAQALATVSWCKSIHHLDLLMNGKNHSSLVGAISRELVPPSNIPPDETGESIEEKSRSVQLNDEDLNPEIKMSKSLMEKLPVGLQRGHFPSKDSEEVILSVGSNNTVSVIEDGSDPTLLRTILSPGEEEEAEKLQGK